jgi:hypothetical protein
MDGRLGFRGPAHAGLLGLVASVLVIVGLLGMHGIASDSPYPHMDHASGPAAVPCGAGTDCGAPGPCAAEAHAGMCTPLPPQGAPAPSLPAAGRIRGATAAGGTTVPHHAPPPPTPSLHELSVLRI